MRKLELVLLPALVLVAKVILQDQPLYYAIIKP